MIFSNFTKATSGLVILFKNVYAIENILAVNYFRDDSSGDFSSKKVRWSFDNSSWSPWTTLSQTALSGIKMKGKYLYLEIKYTLSSARSAKVNSFKIGYTELPLISQGPSLAEPRVKTVTITQDEDDSEILLTTSDVPLTSSQSTTSEDEEETSEPVTSTPDLTNGIFSAPTFSNFKITESGKTITFKNHVPITYVEKITRFEDDSAGVFTKKEIRWSFSNDYWSSWETLSAGNLSGITIYPNKYLYLEIRYVQKTEGSGTVSSFLIGYNKLTADQYPTVPTPEDTVITQEGTTCDTTVPVTDRVNVYDIYNADTLCGKSCDYYLWRPNHKGTQSISTVEGLQEYLNSLGDAINSNLVTYGYVDASLDRIKATYIPDVSFGNDFYWENNYLRVNVAATQVSFQYVDGSLLARDASISSNILQINQLDSSIERIDASLNDILSQIGNTDTSINDIWVQINYIDISINDIWVEIANLDGSISYNLIQINQLDASIERIDASLGDYVRKDGDTMSGSLVINASLNVNNDVSIGGNLIVVGDASLGTISIDSSNHIHNVGHISFGMDPILDPEEGDLYWNSDKGTLNLGMPGGTVIQQIGLEDLVRVTNKSGADIPNGRLVYVTGSQGNRITIDLADKTDPNKLFILGMTTEDIPDNASGWVAQRGEVNAVDTSTFTEGDTLWLNSNGLPTNVYPGSATSAVIKIGRVVKAHLTEGTIHLQYPNSFTLGYNVNSTLRQSVINDSSGTSAAVGFTAVIDGNRFVTFGLAGQNNTAFPGSVAVMYTPGYGDFLQAVDGAKDFVWIADPSDLHNNSALGKEIMRLSYDGSLRLNKYIAGTLQTDASGFVTTIKVIPEASLGIWPDGSLFWNAQGFLDVSIATGTTINSLNDIGDVSVGGAAVNQVLTWNGTYWVAQDVSSAGAVSFSYVDGSLAARDASISLLFQENDIQDASIQYLTDYVNDLSTNGTGNVASYSTIFDGTTDVSLTIPYSTHGVTNDTSSLIVAVYEDDDLVWTSVNVDRSTANVKINWISGLMSANCRCVITG